MKIKVYQINMKRDRNGMCFLSWDWCQKHGGFDFGIYDVVFDGDVEAETLEDVYSIFNHRHPKDYCGWSMSVSDLVEVSGKDGKKLFFCDSIGFVEVTGKEVRH